MRRQGFSIFLLILAISDNILVVFGSISWFNSVLHYHGTSGIVSYNSRIQCFLVVLFPRGSTLVSSWLIVAIAWQRAFVVRFPFGRIFFTKGKSRIFAFSTAFIASLFAFPTAISTVFIRKHGNYWEHVWCYIDSNIQRVLRPYVMTLDVILPVILIVIANILIFSTLFSSSQSDVRSTKEKNNMAKITVMLVTVTATFLLLLLPHWILSQVRHAFPVKLYYSISEFTRLLQYANHCINFFIYVVSGREVREVFLNLICGSRAKGRTVSS